MSFSIKNYRNTATKLVILDPVSGKPFVDPDTNESVIFDIVNQESREFADAKLEAELKTLELMKEGKKLDPKDHRALAFEMFSAMVTGWNATAAKFIEAEYSKENVLKLLSDSEHYWLVKQIEGCLADRSRFFQNQ